MGCNGQNEGQPHLLVQHQFTEKSFYSCLVFVMVLPKFETNRRYCKILGPTGVIGRTFTRFYTRKNVVENNSSVKLRVSIIA